MLYVWQSFSKPSRRFAGGMLAIRPNKDGRIIGYLVLRVKENGENIIQMYLTSCREKYTAY